MSVDVAHEAGMAMMRLVVMYSLSSRYTSYVFVPDLGIDSVGDTEDAHDDISGVSGKLPPSQTGRGMFMLQNTNSEDEHIEDWTVIPRDDGLTDLASAAKAKVSPTVKAGKWTSCSAV
jgi:hypothetical protein